MNERKIPDESINIPMFLRSDEYQREIAEKIADKVIEGEVKLEVIEEDK